MRHNLRVLAFLVVANFICAPVHAWVVCWTRSNGIVQKCFYFPDAKEQDPHFFDSRKGLSAPGSSSGMYRFTPGAFGESGPVIAGAVMNIASTITGAMAQSAQADLERVVRYQPQSVYLGSTPAQIIEDHNRFYKRLDEQQKKIAENVNSGVMSSDDEREALSAFQRLKERMKVKDIIESRPLFKDVKPNPYPDIVKVAQFDADGLSDDQIDYLQFAANEAESLKAPDVDYKKGSARWNDRFERAQRYWKDADMRALYAKVRLSERARTIFSLPDITSDSFENYEIITAANQLARDTHMHDPFRKIYVSLTLKQAHGFARHGDLFASSKMVENALSDRDFAHGAAKGLFQNVYDTVSGLWHLVRHPIESAKALANAIINFEETFELISAHMNQIAADFQFYDADQKGRLFGYLATEIATIAGTGGASLVAEVGKIAKLSEGIAIATEKTLQTLKIASQIDPYLVQKVGKIYVAPRALKAFPGAQKERAMTFVQGGGPKRKRWYDTDSGYTFEWDSRHGTVEKYQGKKHIGEFDPVDGRQLKPANPQRRLEQ